MRKCHSSTKRRTWNRTLVRSGEPRERHREPTLRPREPRERFVPFPIMSSSSRDRRSASFMIITIDRVAHKFLNCCFNTICSLYSAIVVLFKTHFFKTDLIPICKTFANNFGLQQTRSREWMPQPASRMAPWPWTTRPHCKWVTHTPILGLSLLRILVICAFVLRSELAICNLVKNSGVRSLWVSFLSFLFF